MCGIVGIWNPERADQTEAARLAFFSLYALQHRGQESAGIAATDGRDMRIVRRMGLVGQVFSEPDLGVLGGRAAIGHTRYSTTGANAWANAQPLVHHGRTRTVALGHNGNLTNTNALRDALAADGIELGATSARISPARVCGSRHRATPRSSRRPSRARTARPGTIVLRALCRSCRVPGHS